MKHRLIPTIALTLLLVACSKITAGYVLNVNPALEDKYRALLPIAASRVVERRLASMEAKAEDISFGTHNGKDKIVLELATEELKLNLNDRVLQPFSFEVMLEVDTPEEADVTVAAKLHFKRAGITGTDVGWIVAGRTEDDFGAARIDFTAAGAEKMRALLAENEGKNIGLFIRGNLTAKLLVEPGSFQDHIAISQIPSVELAHVFADDVNVGLHVTFEPLN